MGPIPGEGEDPGAQKKGGTHRGWSVSEVFLRVELEAGAQDQKAGQRDARVAHRESVVGLPWQNGLWGAGAEVSGSEVQISLGRVPRCKQDMPQGPVYTEIGVSCCWESGVNHLFLCGTGGPGLAWGQPGLVINQVQLMRAGVPFPVHQVCRAQRRAGRGPGRRL